MAIRAKVDVNPFDNLGFAPWRSRQFARLITGRQYRDALPDHATGLDCYTLLICFGVGLPKIYILPLIMNIFCQLTFV